MGQAPFVARKGRTSMTEREPRLFEASFPQNGNTTPGSTSPQRFASLPGPALSELREALFRSLLHRIPSGFAVFDGELRFLMVNDALAAMHGVPPEAHLGRKLRDVVPLTSLEVMATIQRVFDTGEP